jgi:citrate synthase
MPFLRMACGTKLLWTADYQAKRGCRINLLSSYADALLKWLGTCSSNAAFLREFGMSRLPGWIARTLSAASVREHLK